MKLGYWSGMKKYLERDMLAETLKGRVKYYCSSYRGMDDLKMYEVFFDKKLLKRFSLCMVQTYFHREGLIGKPGDKYDSNREYWNSFWKTLNDTPIANRTEYIDVEFEDALESYLNSDIASSLSSADPIRKMFALFDRRTSKKKVADFIKAPGGSPAWLVNVAGLRSAAEMIVGGRSE